MIEGTPTEVGTYLARFIMVSDYSKSPIYKVVYLDKNHGLLLAPDDSYVTHYQSIDLMESLIKNKVNLRCIHLENSES